MGIHKKIVILMVLMALFAFSGADGAFISDARLMGMTERQYDELVKPVKGQKTIRAKFRESFHAGSYREIGRSHAGFQLTVDPDLKANMLKVYDALAPKDSPMRKTDANLIRERLGLFFPEIIEEIEGFAEVVGLDRDDAMRLLSMYGGRTGTRGRLFGNCSVFAVGKDRSTTGGPLVGRSYEWFARYCDMSVAVTRPAGGYASVGSSHHFVGRLDGMNEHGLFIGIMASLSIRKGNDGFLFPIIVRAVLDKAKNVDEAIAILRKAPHSDGNNYLIADRSGNAAVVELIPGRILSVRYLRDDPDGVLISTNHFQNRGTTRKNSFIMPNSYERVRILNRKLRRAPGKIAPADVAVILGNERPDGVFWRYHESGFGTIYSGNYDLQKGTWLVKTGQIEKEYTVATDRAGSEDVAFENVKGDITPTSRAGNVLDMASLDGFQPVDQNSFYVRGQLFCVGSDYLVNPGADISFHYKMGLGSERTYGPHFDISLFSQATGLYYRGGATVAFKPVPLFTLDISPFYYLSYAQNCQQKFTVKKCILSPTERTALTVNGGLKKRHASPGLSVNPIITIGGFVTLENAMSFYFFKERIFQPVHNMLVKKTFVWSPSVRVLVPYSRHFLWGVQGGGTIKVSLDGNDPYVGEKYNAHAGPIVVFPTIAEKLNLAVMGSYWIKRSDRNSRFFAVVSLQTQI